MVLQMPMGGPFGAAVFERDSGKLIAVGVNRVVGGNCSIAHAEMLALALAQRAVGSYDLGSVRRAACELVSSAEPCAMCLGAIPWSGINRVVTAAKDVDARNIGFDEGAKPDDWIKSLNDRGIEVIDGIERQAARDVLELYSRMNGNIYNT